MKRLNLFLNALLLLVVAVGCNDEFDTPPMVVPQAEHQANMTIAEFKAKYWQDGRNFIDTCKEDTYLHGFVTSSDEEGNIYKYLYIQDETAGIGISIDANSIYNTYRVGQEIVINMKDFWIGKYNGQYLIGKPEWYAAQGVWEAGRMTLDQFNEHVELNGLPNPSNITPVEVEISDVVGHSDKETQLKYQGQFVIIRDVEWEAADGETPYSESGSSTVRNIVDEDGNTLGVNNSNYANFRAEALPVGRGDVQGILYMTGDDKWAMYLRDTNDCISFPDDLKGYLVDPYNVTEAIGVQNTGAKGWVKGYVVGAVAPGVSSVSSNEHIEWTAPTTLDNTLVMADDPNERDYTKCIVVELPQGSSFRRDASLRDYPELLGSEIWVKGTLATYLDMAGITDNSGSTDEYKLTIMTGGVTELYEDFEEGSLPSGWKSVKVKGDKDWYFPSAYDNNTYIAVSGYNGKQPPFDAWLITPALDIKNAGQKTLSFLSQVNGYGSTTSKLEVYVMSTNDPTTAELVQLNPTMAVAPSSGYSGFVASGDVDLSQFDGTYCIGFRYTAEQEANYATWCLDNVKFGGKALLQTIDDFETMNGGTVDGMSQTKFGNLTSTKGWTATNCGLFCGTDGSDAPPYYHMIGKKADGSERNAFAVHVNGNLNAQGIVYSPIIHGGIKTLSFNYGYVLTEANGVQFRVTILQEGNQVNLASFDVINTTAEKGKAYTHTQELNINADNLIILIKPLSPSQASTNKDRFAIWNIVWENTGE